MDLLFTCSLKSSVESKTNPNVIITITNLFFVDVEIVIMPKN